MAKKNNGKKYYEAIGRRKEAVARVRLYIVGKDKTVTISVPDEKQAALKIKAGEIYINKQPFNKIFTSIHEQTRFLFPLKLTGNLDRFAVSILVKGGGKSSQLEAIILGLARALCEVDRDSYRSELKKHGLLTRDPRERERRKVGTGGKARRLKQSPKR